MNVDTLDQDFNFLGLRELILQYSPNLELNTVHPNDLVDSVSKGLGQEGIMRLYSICVSQLKNENKKTANDLAKIIDRICNFNQSAYKENQIENSILIAQSSHVLKDSDSMSEKERISLPRKRKFDFISNGNNNDHKAFQSLERIRKKQRVESISNKKMNEDASQTLQSNKYSRRGRLIKDVATHIYEPFIVESFPQPKDKFKSVRSEKMSGHVDATISSEQTQLRKKGRKSPRVQLISDYAQFIMETFPEHKVEKDWETKKLKTKAGKAKVILVSRNTFKRSIMHMKDCVFIPERHREIALRFYAYLYDNNFCNYQKTNISCEYCKNFN